MFPSNPSNPSQVSAPIPVQAQQAYHHMLQLMEFSCQMFSQQAPNKAALMTNLYQTTRNYYDVFGCYHVGTPIEVFFPQVLSQLKSLPPWFQSTNCLPGYAPVGPHPTIPANSYLPNTTIPFTGQSTVGIPFPFQFSLPLPPYHHTAPPVVPIIGLPPNHFNPPPTFNTTVTTPHATNNTANAVDTPGVANAGMTPLGNQATQEIMSELRNLRSTIHSAVRLEIRRMTPAQNNGQMPPMVDTGRNSQVVQDDISDLTLGVQNGNRPASDPGRVAESTTVVSTASSQTRSKYVSLLKVPRLPPVTLNHSTPSKALEEVNTAIYCTGPASGSPGQITLHRPTSRAVKKTIGEYMSMYINVRCTCHGNHPPLRISQRTPSATQLDLECLESYLAVYQNHFHPKFSPEDYIRSILNEETFGVWTTHNELYLFVIERIFSRRQQDARAQNAWSNLICGVDNLGASKVRDIIESYLSNRLHQQPSRNLGISDYSPSPGNTGQGILDYVRTNNISRYMQPNKHQQLLFGQVTFADLSAFMRFWNFESPNQILTLSPNLQRYANMDFQQQELDEAACNVIFICPAHIYAAYTLMASTATEQMGFYMIDGKFKLHRSLGGNGGVLIHFGACDLNVHNWSPNQFSRSHVPLGHSIAFQENGCSVGVFVDTLAQTMEHFTGKAMPMKYVCSDMSTAIRRGLTNLSTPTDRINLVTDIEHLRNAPLQKWKRMITTRANARSISSDINFIYSLRNETSFWNAIDVAIKVWNSKEPDFASFFQLHYAETGRLHPKWFCGSVPYFGHLPLSQTIERYFQSLGGVPSLGRPGILQRNHGIERFHDETIPQILLHDTNILSGLNLGNMSNLNPLDIPIPFEVLAIVALMGDQDVHDSPIDGCYYVNSPFMLGEDITHTRIEAKTTVENTRVSAPSWNRTVASYVKQVTGLCHVFPFPVDNEEFRHLSPLATALPYLCECLSSRQGVLCPAAVYITNQKGLLQPNLDRRCSQRYSGGPLAQRGNRRRRARRHAPTTIPMSFLRRELSLSNEFHSDKLCFLASLSHVQLAKVMRLRRVFSPRENCSKSSMIIALIEGTSLGVEVMQQSMRPENPSLQRLNNPRSSVSQTSGYLPAFGPPSRHDVTYFNPYPQGVDLLFPDECATFLLGNNDGVIEYGNIFLLPVLLAIASVNDSQMPITSLNTKARELWNRRVLHNHSGTGSPSEFLDVVHQLASRDENREMFQVQAMSIPIQQAAATQTNNENQSNSNELLTTNRSLAMEAVTGLVDRLLLRDADIDTEQQGVSAALRFGKSDVQLCLEWQESESISGQYEFIVHDCRRINICDGGILLQRPMKTVLTTTRAAKRCIFRHWESIYEQEGNRSYMDIAIFSPTTNVSQNDSGNSTMSVSNNNEDDSALSLDEIIDTNLARLNRFGTGSNLPAVEEENQTGGQQLSNNRHNTSPTEQGGATTQNTSTTDQDPPSFDDENNHQTRAEPYSPSTIDRHPTSVDDQNNNPTGSEPVGGLTSPHGGPSRQQRLVVPEKARLWMLHDRDYKEIRTHLLTLSSPEADNNASLSSPGTFWEESLIRKSNVAEEVETSHVLLPHCWKARNRQEDIIRFNFRGLPHRKVRGLDLVELMSFPAVPQEESKLPIRQREYDISSHMIDMSLSVFAVEHEKNWQQPGATPLMYFASIEDGNNLKEITSLSHLPTNDQTYMNTLRRVKEKFATSVMTKSSVYRTSPQGHGPPTWRGHRPRYNSLFLPMIGIIAGNKAHCVFVKFSPNLSVHHFIPASSLPEGANCLTEEQTQKLKIVERLIERTFEPVHTTLDYTPEIHLFDPVAASDGCSICMISHLLSSGIEPNEAVRYVQSDSVHAMLSMQEFRIYLTAICLFNHPFPWMKRTQSLSGIQDVVDVDSAVADEAEAAHIATRTSTRIQNYRRDRGNSPTESERCPICMDDLISSASAISDQCQHLLCYTCARGISLTTVFPDNRDNSIDFWLSGRCPTCRRAGKWYRSNTNPRQLLLTSEEENVGFVRINRASQSASGEIRIANPGLWMGLILRQGLRARTELHVPVDPDEYEDEANVESWIHDRVTEKIYHCIICFDWFPVIYSAPECVDKHDNRGYCSDCANKTFQMRGRAQRYLNCALCRHPFTQFLSNNNDTLEDSYGNFDQAYAQQVENAIVIENPDTGYYARYEDLDEDDLETMEQNQLFRDSA